MEVIKAFFFISIKMNKNNFSLKIRLSSIKKKSKEISQRDFFSDSPS